MLWSIATSAMLVVWGLWQGMGFGKPGNQCPGWGVVNGALYLCKQPFRLGIELHGCWQLLWAVVALVFAVKGAVLV
jgi:hypothetical protein